MKTETHEETHLLLDHDGHRIWCVHCGKTLEVRNSLPDYVLFMADVWRHRNLPCNPFPENSLTKQP